MSEEYAIELAERLNNMLVTGVNPQNDEPIVLDVSWEIVEDDDPRAHKLFVTNHGKTLRAFFPFGTSDIAFHENQYLAELYNGQDRETVVQHCFTATMDASLRRTCKFYHPSAEEQAKGALPHPGYPYYNAVDVPVCMNPELANTHWMGNLHVVCNFKNRMESCESSDLHSWTERGTITAGDRKLTIQSNILGGGFERFRIVEQTPQSLKTLIVFDKGTTESDVFEDKLPEFLKALDISDPEITRIPLPDTDDVPVSFIGSIFLQEAVNG